MAFTMMATAGAAYTDQADIKATEAVEMLNALSVMTGDPNGSFRPNDTITRAEAARMIYTIRTNSDNADNYADMQTTFKDVPADAWYAGYVKHCQAAGIISGTKADGSTFEPSREVTGVELALMCLRVMGYDPAKADIGGSTWSTKTIGLATENGLLDGVNTTITSACPRQWAAQIMYNMIEAPTVQWSTDTNSYTKYFDDGSKRPTVGKEYLKLWIDVGTLTEVDGENLTIVADSSDAEDSDGYKAAGTYGYTKLSKDYSSLLGQKVKVLYRDGKTNNVIGVYAMDNNSSMTVNMKDIEKDGDKVKFGGKSYGFDDGSKIKVVVLDPTSEKVDTSKTMSADDFDTVANKTKTASVNFIDNDSDGKFNIAIITEYLTKEVTYVGSDRITAGATYKFSDENIADGFAKDDWAAISYNMYKDCLDIVKAEVVTGELSSSKTKEGGAYYEYEIGNNWYNISKSEAEKVSVGDTVKAYIVGGIIVSIDTDDGTGSVPNNIAVVVGNATGNSTTVYGDQVKLRFFDGSTKTVTVDSDSSGNYVKGSDTKLGQAYKISGSDSNTKLEKLDTGKKYNGYTFITKQTVYTSATGEAITDANGSNTANTKLDKISGTKVDDAAVIVLFDGNGNSKKITGKQFKAIASNDTKLGTTSTAAWSAFTKDVNGLERVLMASVKVTNTDISGTSYDNYGYIVADGQSKANGDVSFQMWNGSELKTVLVENGTESKCVKGALVAYSSINDKGYLQDVAYFGTMETIKNAKTTGVNNTFAGANMADSAKVVSIDESQLADTSFGGSNVGKQLNVTSNTHVLVVDSDADDADKVGQPYKLGDKLTTAEKNADGKYLFNMVYRVEDGNKVEDDSDLDLLVIDITGSFYFNKPQSTSKPSTPDTSANEYKDEASLKAALASGNVTATGAIPAGTYISNNTLTLKNAVLTGTVNVIGSVVVDGKLTKMGSGALEVANGAVTLKNGAVIGDMTINNAASITDENATVSAADVNTMLAKTSTVTVKDVSDALTVNAAGKTLNLGNAKDTITVSAGTVNAAALTSGKAVTVSAGATLNVASDTTLANTDTVAGTLVITGKLTTTGACAFAGDVKATTISVGASYTVAANKTLELTAATAAADLEKVTGAAADAKFIHVGSSDTTTNITATNSNTAKFYSAAGKLDSASGEAATPAVETNKIKAGTYVWNTTTINAGQADAATNQTPLAAWLSK